MRQYETSHDQRTSLLEKLTADKEKALEKVNDLQQEVKEKRNEMENVEQLMYGSQQDVSCQQLLRFLYLFATYPFVWLHNQLILNGFRVVESTR